LDIAIQYVSEGGASEQMRLVFGMRALSTSLSYDESESRFSL
jgi:hypothetical protein